MSCPPIRLAGSADESTMVGVLADAFADDPVMRWTFDDDSVRAARGMPALFRTFLRSQYLALGACDLTEGGVAVWAPPGKADPGALGTLRQVPGMLWAYRMRMRRPGQLAATMGKTHPHEPHWYLQFLGVRQRSRGQGTGGALLAARLATIDSTGMPAYLESSNPRNLTLYRRHGFEVTGELRPTADAPPLYAMWRPAASRH